MSQSQSSQANNWQHPKISVHHLQRTAYIYVRQSSLKQVQHNQESRQYQYRLQQRAHELGWSDERIRVIDSDLGRSASDVDGRIGFQELVAEVSLGRVGIVFGYEVSRLARNNRDWYHLLDLAAIGGTLIADSDGIYDPRLYNDRLLLGLKGTMSEAELHLLRQRLAAGRLNQVKRGAYQQRLPTGYVRLPDGTAVKDPDDQVRHVIELVFTQFEKLGSVNRVIRYLRQQKILLPRRQSAGPWANQLLWKVASEHAVTHMLGNPAYAGAFAYGRRQLEPGQHKAGRPATGRMRKPMAEWIHLEQNVYPAYISWEQYLANQERIRRNGMRFVEGQAAAQGIVRNGPGLLQGMTLCGRCGHHMQIVYKRTPRYVCHGLSRTTDAPSDCTSVRAPTVDEAVVAAFLAAIQPAQLDALDQILAAQRTERAQLERQWQERLKRAQYESHLAQRQYDAVDPDNRLVTSELERRWEQALRHYQQTEEEYRLFQQSPPPDTIPAELRALFQDVSRRLPELWPSLTNFQRKELLRTLIRSVIVKRPLPDQIALRIVWISGHYSDLSVRTIVHGEKDVANHDQLVERVRDLWGQGFHDEQIAAQLTKEGFHSARSAFVTPTTVQKIRLARQWYLPFERLRNAEEFDGHWTVHGLAKQLQVEDSTIHRFIYKHVIPLACVTQHPHARIYLIRKDEELLENLRQRILRNKRRNGMIKS